MRSFNCQTWFHLPKFLSRWRLKNNCYFAAERPWPLSHQEEKQFYCKMTWLLFDCFCSGNCHLLFFYKNMKLVSVAKTKRKLFHLSTPAKISGSIFTIFRLDTFFLVPSRVTFWIIRGLELKNFHPNAQKKVNLLISFMAWIEQQSGIFQ